MLCHVYNFVPYIYISYDYCVYTCALTDRSESPSQAFLVVILWLYQTLQKIPVSEWGDVVLSYDNMCHLDSLRAAANPLPLPEPYSHMWLKITKV